MTTPRAAALLALAALLTLPLVAPAAPPSGDAPPTTETPTEPPVEPAPPPSAPPVPAGTLDPNSIDIKLRELEERVVGLKEKVFKSKTRLLLLKEQLLNNAIAEAGAVVTHVHDMGPAFKLEQVLYTLDGERIYFQDNRDGALNKVDRFQVFNGIVTPGDHIVGVELTYRGDGTVFDYIDGYQFRVRSTYTFQAAKGRITEVQVVGFERGGMTTSLEEKPYVRYERRDFQYSRQNQKKADEGRLGDTSEGEVREE